MTSKMDEALSDEIKEEIREALQSIKRKTPGFRDRPSQRVLIAEVARTLSGFYGERRILVAEAPTGTGKSIGYMLGAIPVAKARNKRVIIATGTVALQEQLVNRDIPALQQRSGLEFSFLLAKGRGRYACNRNIAELTGSDARQSSLELGESTDSAAWPFLPDDQQVKLVMDMEAALEERSWGGDLDEWKGARIDDDIRRVVVTDHGGCLGRNCKHFYQCGFHKTRADMKDADVIVANHDLVMSDIHLGGGAILPSPEDCIYVFDEAHHLPDVALAHGAAESHLRRTQELIGKTPKALTEAFSVLRMAADKAKSHTIEARALAEELIKALKEAETYLGMNFPNTEAGRFQRKGEPEFWRFPHGIPPQGIDVLATNIITPAETLLLMVNRKLESLRDAFKKKLIEQNAATKVGKNLSYHRERIEALVKTWTMMRDQDKPGRPPVARWITRIPGKGRGGRGAELVASCCPTSAANLLRFGIWEVAAGVVLASATVSAMGRFNRFAERAGLALNDGTQFLRLDSPFNYPENGELVVPQMVHDPGRPEEHTREVITLLNREIDPDQGTLVLFSARRQMLEVAEEIDACLRDRLLIQGEKSKNEILEMHAKRIEAGEGSIIFGLASFAEGVDLPGRLCEHVLIAKLPFAVPDSPVDATYSEWLESSGRNPFMEISVPDACTKLVQACGRLIRTETDKGRITLLDRRVITKRYGAQILDSLPPFRRRIDPVLKSA